MTADNQPFAHTVEDLAALPDTTVVTIAGRLTNITPRVSERGLKWASATLTDNTGTVEVLVFPNAYALLGQHLGIDQPVAIRGRLDRGDGDRVLAMDMSVLDVHP